MKVKFRTEQCTICLLNDNFIKYFTYKLQFRQKKFACADAFIMNIEYWRCFFYSKMFNIIILVYFSIVFIKLNPKCVKNRNGCGTCSLCVCLSCTLLYISMTGDEFLWLWKWIELYEPFVNIMLTMYLSTLFVRTLYSFANLHLNPEKKRKQKNIYIKPSTIA